MAAAVLRPEVDVLASVGRITPIKTSFNRRFNSSTLLFTFAATVAIAKSRIIVHWFVHFPNFIDTSAVGRGCPGWGGRCGGWWWRNGSKGFRAADGVFPARL